MSSEHPQEDQKAKLHERLDRISELESLNHNEAKAYIFPFNGKLKKLKVRGNVALRPILVRGPFNQDHEATFLVWATERDGKLVPSKASIVRTATERLQEIMSDRHRRRRYEWD